MKQKDAAEHVLKKKGRPMHVKDIAEQAVDDGLIESDNPDVKGALAARIWTDIKNLGDESRFVKVKGARATYGLRAWQGDLLDESADMARKENSDGAGERSRGTMTYKDAAYKILLEEGGPLHKNEIAKRAKKRGLIKKTDHKRIGDFIAAMIGTEIRKMGVKSRFSKEKPSTYGLSEAGRVAAGRSGVPAGGGPSPGPRGEPDGPPQGPKGPDYTGPAGEHRVQSELLFRGYQTSKPEPDIGVDIVANKGGKEFHIQVKSSNIQSGSYHYNIKKSSFEKTKKKNVYYVFVMGSPIYGSVNFVIVSRSIMLSMIKAGTISAGSENYQVNLKIKGGTVYCKGENMARYKNDWTID